MAPWLRNLVGAALVLGSAALAVAALARRLAQDMPPILGLFIAALFLLAGLWMLRAERLLGSSRPPIDWDTFWAGGIAMALGAFLMAVSVADPRDEAFHAPRWVVTVAGSVFLFAGVAVLRKAVYGAEAERKGDLFSGLLVGLILTGFGAICTWVAFGPGEREFSGGVSLPGVSVGFLSGETPGRIAFGLAAVFLDGLALFAWAALAAGLLGRRRE